MREIRSIALKLSDVPLPDAREPEIFDFASSFDGYRENPGETDCANIANRALQAYEESGAIPTMLHELRTCLFFEYRRSHHSGDQSSSEALAYLRALVNGIRRALTTPSPGPKHGPASLRPCIRAPPPEIAVAARYLDAAVTAHLQGQTGLAEELIRAANIASIYSWLKPIWANSEAHVRVAKAQLERTVPKDKRAPVRMPSKPEKARIHERDGHSCRFCGMPVVRKEVRDQIRKKYPDALRWGRKEGEQHAAFQAMWAQYDHLLPHALGGTNELQNIVLACAACNFGRGGYSLNDVGVEDPLGRSVVKTSWDGLERFR